MSNKTTIANMITNGDPDSIEDLSDVLEALLRGASKSIVARVSELMASETKQLQEESKEYTPIDNATLCVGDLERERIQKIMYDVLMETVYLPVMMKENYTRA